MERWGIAGSADSIVREIDLQHQTQRISKNHGCLS